MSWVGYLFSRSVEHPALIEILLRRCRKQHDAISNTASFVVSMLCVVCVVWLGGRGGGFDAESVVIIQVCGPAEWCTIISYTKHIGHDAIALHSHGGQPEKFRCVANNLLVSFPVWLSF